MTATNPISFQNPHSLKNRIGRLAWSVFWAIFFRPTPWFMGAYRTWLLKLWGAQIVHARFHSSVRIWAPWLLRCGKNVYVDRNVFLYNTYGLELGDRVIVSFGTVLCTPTHDFRDPSYPLIGKQITVRNDVWIAAEAFVMPGVTIGEGAIVGARAVVAKDVEPWTVVTGNPAQMVRRREMKQTATTGDAGESSGPRAKLAG